MVPAQHPTKPSSSSLEGSVLKNAGTRRPPHPAETVTQQLVVGYWCRLLFGWLVRCTKLSLETEVSTLANSEIGSRIGLGRLFFCWHKRLRAVALIFCLETEGSFEL
jgi:hypothetical protein